MSTVVVDGAAGIDSAIDGATEFDLVLDGEYGEIVRVNAHDLPTYTGATTVTPTTETQTLQTANKSVLSDITINPIPSNYGLITWNGSNLMIS